MERLWSALEVFPAWRALNEHLRDLAFLLGRAGRGEDSNMGELAGQVELLIADPGEAAALLPPEYRVRLPLGKAVPDADEDELSAWMVELARHVSDVPVLLDAPAAARELGQMLTTELPRAWAARVAGPLFRLRQAVRGAGGNGFRGRPPGPRAGGRPPWGDGAGLCRPCPPAAGAAVAAHLGRPGLGAPLRAPLGGYRA
ncbi:MAG TPA: hypothetical protein VD969_28135 [Symbiobacteriaceae bacterium]|nr:hypothetical protein [Symbiobacteriaceae bacterium]